MLPNSVVTTRNNSKIEDAEIAINTGGGFANRILFIENTIFNRNRIGINLAECLDLNGLPCLPPFPSLPAGIMPIFRGNQFTCTAPLKGTLDEYTFAGVKSKYWSIIDYPNSSYNRFSDLQYGILAEGKSEIGATKMIFHRIKQDGIYLEEGRIRLSDSHFFDCARGIGIGKALLVDLKNVSFVLPSGGGYGVQILSTGFNAPLNFNFIVVHGTSVSEFAKKGIEISNIITGTKIKVDGGSVFNLRGNYSFGVSLGGLPPGSFAEIIGNHFKVSSAGAILSGNPPSAAGIITGGNINNLSIKSNTFTAYALPYYDFFIGKDRGISLGTNISGTNNEISLNAFNDDVLTLHDAVYVNGFQNMKYCSNELSGSRTNATGFNFNGTCTGTDLIANKMTFGDASPAFSSIGLLINGNTQINSQTNKGNEWHNLLGSEPLNHARCDAIPAFNKFFVHTSQSTCADENNSTCFFKYHPRKVTPDISNEFFDIDPMGSPDEGCADGSGTDELDRIIAQGLFETPIDDPAMGWVLERYLYQKLKENPALLSEHASFSSFMMSKDNGTVGRFYEIQKNIDNALTPAENLNLQSQQALAELDDLMKSVEEVDEEIEMVLSDSEYALLLQNKTGLLDQTAFLNRTLDSLRILYQGQIALNLQSAYALNESVSTSYLYETNEKAVNHIYLLSITQQGGELTANQVLALQSIANQDPKFAGPAVYRALEMLPYCAKSEISLGYSTSNGEYWNEFVVASDRIKNPLTNPIDEKIIVSPNPAYSTFKVNGLSNSEGTLSIIDLQGRLIMSHTIPGNEVEIELAPNVSSGLYLIKIVLEDGSNHILKLVIRPK